MSASMIRRGALIAGAAAALLFAAMFLDWFTDNSAGAQLNRDALEVAEEFEGLDIRDEAEEAKPDNGWNGLGWLRLILVIAALGSAFAFAAVTLTKASVSTPIALAAIVTGTGVAAFLGILLAAFNPPGGDSIERDAGLYVGLIGCTGIVLGGYFGMQEDKPAPRPAQRADGPPPPPSPEPQREPERGDDRPPGPFTTL